MNETRRLLARTLKEKQLTIALAESVTCGVPIVVDCCSDGILEGGAPGLQAAKANRSTHRIMIVPLAIFFSFAIYLLFIFKFF